MIQMIVFDWDGTLTDSALDAAGIVNAIRAGVGLEELIVPRLLRFAGSATERLVRSAIADPSIDSKEALRRLNFFYRGAVTGTTALYPGVWDGLKQLHCRKFNLTVWSSRDSALLEKEMEELGIFPFIDRIFGGDSELPLMPSTSALVKIASLSGCKAQECVLLSDNGTAIASGARAGFQTFRAAWGPGDAGEQFQEGAPFENFAAFTAKILG